MRITLVMPGVGRKPGEKYVNSWKMEPLSLGMLAALTSPDVEVVCADDRMEKIPYDEPTDAVGINVETYSAARAYRIATRFRQRGVPVILGGYHPTLVPHEAQQYADAVVIGSAEPVWGQVVEDLRASRLRPRYQGGIAPTPSGILPRREIFAHHRYLPVTLIETSRGCRFACEFCSVSRFYKQNAVGRAAEDVLAEIEAAGNRNVFFVDDNMVTDAQQTIALCDTIKSAGIRWFSQASINMADDTKLLASMRESGCHGVLIGFESLSKNTLAAMGKSWNRAVCDYEDAIRRIRDAGIPIYATFVFGYDTDDADAIDRSVEFAIKQKFQMAAFNHLVPFPGTPLYERIKKEGRLRFDAWWLHPEARFGDVSFHPRQMSADELAQRCYEARRAFYRFGSVVSRAVDLKCNCRSFYAAMMYFWTNLFSGRQAENRQGLPLGHGFDDDESVTDQAELGRACS